MQCTKCHTPLLPEDQFCPNCGQPVAQPAQVPQPVVQSSAPKSKKKISVWLWVAIILVVLLLCCGLVAGGYFLFMDQGNITVPPQGNQDVFALQETVSVQETAVANQEAGPVQSAPQDETTPQETAVSPNIHEMGLNIWYDHAVMQGVSIVQVEANMPGDYIAWEYWPMHLSLEIDDPQGEIHFVPVDTYASMGEFASETMRDLQSTLQSQPGYSAVDCTPTWAFPCAHQEMNTEVAYFDFQNGSGIRTVSVFAPQNTSAINNEALDYYYNGLTDDGLYYVYARFELRHSSLSEDVWDVPLDVMTEIEALEAYVMGYAMQLAASQEGYEPQLADLDAVIQSLRVEPD